MRTKIRILLIVCSVLVMSLPLQAQEPDATESPLAQTIQTVLPTIQGNVIAPDVAERIRAIYAEGQRLGNRDTVFSKIGDSMTVSRSYLYPFGVGNYDLGNYAYLETVITHYGTENARIGNAFINESLAAHEGWTAARILDGRHSNATLCNAGEPPVLCEYRLVRPSIALIMLGTNDAVSRSVDDYMADMRDIVHYTRELGIVPVLSTIPHLPSAATRVITYNQALRDFAIEQEIALIDVYPHTVVLFNHGLTSDNIHLSTPPTGVSGVAAFHPNNLNYGYTVRNLLTLDMLYRIREILNAM